MININMSTWRSTTWWLRDGDITMNGDCSCWCVTKVGPEKRGVVAQQRPINITAKNMTEAETVDEDMKMLRPFQYM